MGTKPRPVVLVSRDSEIQVRRLILAAPVTSRIRRLDSEVLLGQEDGLHKSCVANTSNVGLVSKARLIRRISTLSSSKRDALDAALLFSLGLD
ncbi:MAG TPA: type II toxin-antitoxin system PemK/MazF family toxin [Elusimicrobiota bacterium]|nr:type II toxin-antitoxin system PemK/MazF family toxin [Elusimicrobiota bacterium]